VAILENKLIITWNAVAKVGAEFDIVSVMMEVKGGWNAGLLKDIKKIGGGLRIPSCPAKTSARSLTSKRRHFPRMAYSYEGSC